MECSPPTRPRLGQILLRSGAATREKLVESWEQKVLFGDRLGTNLLATRALTEEALARALGVQHLVPAAFGGNIDVQDTAIRRLTRSFAVARMVVPHHFDAGTLYLLMRDPDDIVTRHDVYRATGMVVVPVVVVEARIWSLLARHYGVQPSLRPIPLDDEAGEQLERAQTALASGAVRAPAASPVVIDQPPTELMSEAEFTSLYVRSPTDEMRPLGIADIEREVQRRREETTSSTLPPDEAIHVEPAAPLDLLRPIAEQLQTFVMPTEAPPPPSAPVATVARQVSDDESGGWVMRRTAQTFDDAHAHDDARPTDPLPPEAAVDVATFVREPPEPAPATALSIADATRLLSGVKSRDALLDIVLRAALSSFRRAALFTVFPTTITAWRAAGDGFSTEMLRGYHVSLDDRTVFKMVVESRAHYLGPLQTFRAHGDFVKRTGRKLPASIAVLPILVGERVVNLIYGDNGHGASVTNDVSELLILTSRISATFESLLHPER